MTLLAMAVLSLVNAGLCAAAVTPTPTPAAGRTVKVDVRNLSGLDVKTNGRGRGLTSGEVIEILEMAGQIIQTDDDGEGIPGDVRCGLGFKFTGISEFPRNATEAAVDAGTIDLGYWASNSQFRGEVASNDVAKAIQSLPGRVKVVKSVSVCGTIKAGVVACAEGGSVILATWATSNGGYGADDSDLRFTGNLWLHELAHLLCLKHRLQPPEPPSELFVNPWDVCAADAEKMDACSDDNMDLPRPLMCVSLASNYRVCNEECEKILQCPPLP